MSTIPDAVYERAEGALWGQLAGDALGSMVEFQSAAAIAARYPGGLTEMGPSRVWGTVAGQPTDDSELAFELADALIEQGAGGYDAERAAWGYLQWYESGPFDMGYTIRGACAALYEAARAGRNLAEAAYAVNNLASKANGALMRHSVLGVWGWALDATELGAVAMADARLTHPHPVCQEASAAFVVALAAVVREGLDGQAALETALSWHGQHGREREVRESLELAAREPPRQYGGLVTNALQNAFYHAVHARSLQEGVVATVMAGDDTDTNAAVAGALLGAIWGEAGLPTSWRYTLEHCRPDETTANPRPPRYWPGRGREIAVRLLEVGATVAGRR